MVDTPQVIPVPQATAPAKPEAPASKPAPPPTPAAKAEPAQKVETPSVSSADILKRASASQPSNPTDVDKETNYREDLEKITDPAVRAVAEKAVKDFESGYHKKFQTLAQQRKELEDLRSQISTWTPQRLQEELKNPAFVQSLQMLQQQTPPQEWSGNAEEWSALTASEKQQFQQMRQETQSLQSQMQKMLQAQEDTEIKKVYPDYEPRVVEEAIEGLRTGKIVASRADIWKVVNHDKNVEKGYQFGYEDGYKKAIEKLNGSSVVQGGLAVTNADEVPDDVRKGGFSSIAMWRLNRSKNGTQK